MPSGLPVADVPARMTASTTSAMVCQMLVYLRVLFLSKCISDEITHVFLLAKFNGVLY